MNRVRHLEHRVFSGLKFSEKKYRTGVFFHADSSSAFFLARN